jgi:hypothetical protein
VNVGSDDLMMVFGFGFGVGVGEAGGSVGV